MPVRLYRVVSQAEFLDLQRCRQFRPGAGSMEVKWFAYTFEAAQAHARILYPSGDGIIVGGEFDDTMMAEAFHAPRIDGIGGVCFDREEMPHIVAVLELNDE